MNHNNNESDFWYYSRSERRAAAVLLTIVAFLFLLPGIYHFIPKNIPDAKIAAFKESILNFEKAQIDSSSLYPVASLFNFDPNTAGRQELEALGLPSSTINTIIKYREKVGRFEHPEDLAKIYNLKNKDFERLKPYVRIERPVDHPTNVPVPAVGIADLLPFDPNTATANELERLNLSKKVVGNLLKYREKGGRFHRAEDLRKIYGFDPKEFDRIKNYVQIHPSGSSENRSTAETTEASAKSETVHRTASITIDINRATAEEWQQLYGIGKVLSNRIIKFREKLGGFVRIDQVAETYGLPDSTFQSIRSRLSYSPPNQLISINTVSADSLKAHPYVQWRQADIIIAFRREHGPFGNLDDLRKVHALTEAFIERIGPYLRFD